MEYIWFVLFLLSVSINVHLYNRHKVLVENFKRTKEAAEEMNYYSNELSKRMKIIQERSLDSQEKVEVAMKVIKEFEQTK